MTESGIAGSAIVEYPDNRMITTILQRTAHLRPTDGSHNQQDKKDRGRDFKPRTTSYKKKVSSEETSKDLDQREGILRAKINTGMFSPFAEVDAKSVLTEIANTRQRLKEKAGLKDAGGKTADLLAQRLKTKAEEDGMNLDLLLQ